MPAYSELYAVYIIQLTGDTTLYNKNIHKFWFRQWFIHCLQTPSIFFVQYETSKDQQKSVAKYFYDYK